MKKTYITTPLYYVNDKPHIGHAYTTILADVLSRINKIQKHDVFFLTGTDEHGQKVQEAAEKRGVQPITHVEEYVKRFKSAWKNLDIEYNDFIRTTEPRHTDRVKDILNFLYENGDIYEDEYEGLYSVSEERFITQKEYEEGSYREVKKLKEKNYFFKMSKYQKKLIEHIKSNEDFILPNSRKNEILGFLNNPLSDLCISRPKKRLSWGIELPFNKDFVTYVWFDALLNYITAIGWNSNEKLFKTYWPADYHLMAKDIITTHGVYWPTMLLACDIPLPKTIFAHGWWLFDDQKMSKSIGNVVNPMDLIENYGSDALRFYLMRNMVLGQDASFTYDSFVKRYNSDLANDYGNLINRILILIKKYFDLTIPEPSQYNDLDLELIAEAKTRPNQVLKEYNNLKIHDAIESTMKLFRSLNKYLELKEPWKYEGNEKTTGTTLFIAINILIMGTKLINPIMPNKTNKLLKQLNTTNINDISFDMIQPGEKIELCNNLFPRIVDNKSK